MLSRLNAPARAPARASPVKSSVVAATNALAHASALGSADERFLKHFRAQNDQGGVANDALAGKVLAQLSSNRAVVGGRSPAVAPGTGWLRAGRPAAIEDSSFDTQFAREVARETSLSAEKSALTSQLDILQNAGRMLAQTRASVRTGAKNPLQAVEWAKADFQNLVFLARVDKTIQGREFDPPQKVYDTLAAISAVSRELMAARASRQPIGSVTDLFKKHGVNDYTPRISPTTAAQHGSAYEFQTGYGPKRFDQHISFMKPGGFSIHLHLLDDGRFIVGHIGKHLPFASR